MSFIPQFQKDTFVSGKSETTWDVRVLDDGLLESTENFVVYIHQPVNAVLGKHRKLRIRLINAEDGMFDNVSFQQTKSGNYIEFVTILKHSFGIKQMFLLVQATHKLLIHANKNHLFIPTFT